MKDESFLNEHEFFGIVWTMKRGIDLCANIDSKPTKQAEVGTFG